MTPNRVIPGAQSGSTAFVLHPDWRHSIDTDGQGRSLSIREFEEIDTFASDISRCGQLRTDVYYMDELNNQAPPNMFICEESVVHMLADHWPLNTEAILAHIFLFNLGRGPKTARRVAALGVAGGIENCRYRVWRTEREDDPGGGLYGRKDIALHIGATWASPGLWETEAYCLMQHDTHVSLPTLLSAYLTAYENRVLTGDL